MLIQSVSGIKLCTHWFSELSLGVEGDAVCPVRHSPARPTGWQCGGCGGCGGRGPAGGWEDIWELVTVTGGSGLGSSIEDSHHQHWNEWSAEIMMEIVRVKSIWVLHVQHDDVDGCNKNMFSPVTAAWDLIVILRLPTGECNLTRLSGFHSLRADHER